MASELSYGPDRVESSSNCSTSSWSLAPSRKSSAASSSSSAASSSSTASSSVCACSRRHSLTSLRISPRRRICTWAVRASSQNPGSALCASSAAIACSKVAKSKTHPEPVETLADDVEVEGFFCGGHHVCNLLRNRRSSMAAESDQDGKYSRALGLVRLLPRKVGSPSSALYRWRLGGAERDQQGTDPSGERSR